jgi:hypothetical protein
MVHHPISLRTGSQEVQRHFFNYVW